MPALYEIESMNNDTKTLFSKLLQYVDNSVGKTELHVFEKNLFEQLQKIGLSLVKDFIAQSGNGYDTEHPPISEDGQRLEYKGTITSPYFSIFGEVSIKRSRFLAKPGKYYYPLDAQLNLPKKKYSYLLQKWLQTGAVETNYQKAVEQLNDIFDYGLFPSMPQRVGKSVSDHVDDFNDEAPPPDESTEGSHLGISADGKGIRMLPSERENSNSNQTPKVRLGKGEKRGTKKQATVTTDFSFTPVSRTPEEIVASLLKELPSQQQPPDEAELKKHKERAAQNKHVRATLDGKDDAMHYLMERLIKRDPEGKKPVIALVDGDSSLKRALEKAFTKYGKRKQLDAIILDIIHVATYVWEVGTALHGERSDSRIPWVRDKLLAILEGNVGRVIGGFKQMVTKQTTTSSQKRVLQKAITYFQNHRDMMKYHIYLEKGYPIATGLVEGTCNCLVKDRMEQSGMRWSKNGATSILKQRAVKLNGDWQSFWDNYMNCQKAVLYPDSYKTAA